MSTDILVVVGPRSFADVRAHTVMRDVMTAYLEDDPPDEIWSGGGEGGDALAEQLALEWGFEFRAILPRMLRWGGEGGYRYRNEYMARHCTRLLGFACRWPSSNGAIWTADKAVSFGKPVERHVIPDRAVNGKIEAWGPDRLLARARVHQGKVVERADDSPSYTDGWIGESVDALLSRLRRQRDSRVRWTGFA